MKVHDARDGFHDLKPEVLTGTEIPWFWIAAAIFLILLIKKYFPKREKKVLKERKKLTVYLEELTTLESNALVSTTPKIFTAEASLVIRRYIFDRTGVSILESTPQEAQKTLLMSEKFTRGTSEDTGKLLSQLENISFSESKSEDSRQSKAVQLIQQCKELIKNIESKMPLEVE